MRGVGRDRATASEGPESLCKRPSEPASRDSVSEFKVGTLSEPLRSDEELVLFLSKPAVFALHGSPSSQILKGERNFFFPSASVSGRTSRRSAGQRTARKFRVGGSSQGRRRSNLDNRVHRVILLRPKTPAPRFRMETETSLPFDVEFVGSREAIRSDGSTYRINKTGNSM